MVAQLAEPFLARISFTFRQFTQHDISHSFNLIALLGRMLPRDALESLNALELALAMMSAILHDSGMYLSDGEKQSILGSAAYQDHLAENSERITAAEAALSKRKVVEAALIEDALLAEFVHRRHTERSRRFIETQFATH